MSLIPLLKIPPEPIHLPEPILLMTEILHTLLGTVKKVCVCTTEKRIIKK